MQMSDAYRVVRDDGGKMTPDGLIDMMKMAGYSEEAAQKAATARAKAMAENDFMSGK